MENENLQQGQQDGQIDLESMSTEQLGEHLDRQNAPPANEQDPADADGATREEEGEGQAVDPITRVERRIEQLQRELGRTRSLQSKFDTLPQTVEQTLQRLLEERDRKAYLDQLPPEEREASERAQRQEQAFKELTRRETLRTLQESFPQQMAFIEKQMEATQQQQFLGQVNQMAEQTFPGSSQHIAELFERNLKELSSDDPATVQKALAWNERATSSPEFVVLELARINAERAKSGNSSYLKQKSAEAAGAKIGVRDGQVSAGTKSAGQYTEAELENMSLEQLEKLVPHR